MNEKAKGILNRIKGVWDKWNKRQKTIIISSVVIVALLIALVAWIVSQPKWEVLAQANNYNEVNEITTLLKENQISYDIGDDALTVSVNKKDLINAKILLGSNNIKAEGYSLEDAVSGGFSTTESDKAKKYKAYLESKISEELSALDSIKAAHVTLTMPESSSVIVSSKEDTSVAVILTLKSEIAEDMGETLAQYLKTAVGNKSTEKITIIASNGMAIYSGENSASNTLGGSLVTQQKYAAQINNTIKSSIRGTLLKLPMFDDAQISLNLDIDYDEVEEIAHTYEAQEGREEGLFSSSYEQSSTGSTGVGGIPGTESNDSDTTYYIQNSDGSVSEMTIKEYNYCPNEFIVTTNKRPGDIIKANSTIAVVLHDNVIYTQEDVEKAGLLKDMTWDEFKASKGKYETIVVDDEIKKMIAYGTGLDVENVTVLAYQVPFFIDKDDVQSSASFWLKVALIGAIVLLLAFMVFRSARPVTVQETEPELSVEDMLATTREKHKQEIEDIDLMEKSDVRVAIEKFVDENPEAVALLLRNWLDDWN